MFVRRSLTVGALSAVALVATVGASGAAAAPSGTAGVADSSCGFVRTLCAWDQEAYQGNRFTAQARNPSTGACVDLAAHGWGGGRVKSARNTANQPARLYTNQNCTGSSYTIMPSGSYSSIDFPSQSVYVY
ncbi:peptidase inhibitor family I36 protein [Micromonospora sp. KC723]|uniref:peptidase inhibitor family I36 protein n=1 Tax=Micromonospora sp. KC723 TaxID=2530381 RepID=UPI001FB813C8|nr:peptidase inhibitor family I36 protein [Micromonospora sp. KC723]